MSEYIQRGKLFEFNLLKCLRTDYFHNDCQECLDICPLEAFYFDRKRLSIDFSKCTNCGVCIGVCPSEALEIKFFNPNDFVAQEKEEVFLSCKEGLPCLSVFSVQHFATLLLRKKAVFYDLSHCQECKLNPDGKTLNSIKARLEEAREFVKELGEEKEFQERKTSPSRRGFFKAIFQTATTLNSPNLSDFKNPLNRVPIKQQLLKNSLKLKPSLPNKHPSTSYSFLANKEIEKSCTNCGDCVQFCPTNALYYNPSGDSIFFVAGRCIDCDICNDICKSESVKDREKIDIIAWAFDREEKLIQHTLEICQECKTPFPYIQGEKICNRCKEFLKDFEDIFKLANED